MDVFISWSGKMSGELAKVLRDWLPSVIQAAKPYFSEDDIEKGTRSNTMLSKELQETGIGILCLTRENLEAPWIMFEAGALSKSLDKSRVCPILYGDLGITDLQGPLTNFQAAKFNKEEMFKVIATINMQLSDMALDPKVLEGVFEKWWPELDEKVKKVLSKTPTDTKVKKRSEKELLEEILTLVRQISYQRIDKLVPVTDLSREEFLELVGYAAAQLEFLTEIKVALNLVKKYHIDHENASMIVKWVKLKRMWKSTPSKKVSNKLEEIKSEIQKLTKTGSKKR